MGHLQAEASLDEQIARSLRRAQLVQMRLTDAGIAAERIQAQGIGPLAPYCSTGPCRQRIEAVLRP